MNTKQTSENNFTYCQRRFNFEIGFQLYIYICIYIYVMTKKQLLAIHFVVTQRYGSFWLYLLLSNFLPELIYSNIQIDKLPNKFSLNFCAVFQKFSRKFFGYSCFRNVSVFRNLWNLIFFKGFNSKLLVMLKLL